MDDQEIGTVSELLDRLNALMNLQANGTSIEWDQGDTDTDSTSAGSSHGRSSDQEGHSIGTTTREPHNIESSELQVDELSASADIAEAMFKVMGTIKHINEAIEYRSQVLSLTPSGHETRPDRLHALGISYLCRYKFSGELSDVDKAIECQTEAVQLTPDDHAAKRARLGNLGVSYEFRFEHLGELADLDKAIESQTRVVQLAPDGHEDKRGGLINLGISYYSRFEHLGELADVDKSIEYLTQAIQLTPEGDEDKASWLSNLGVAYERRFERLGEVADVDKAIECQTQAVKLTPDGHEDKARRLSNLGVSYGSRFEHLKEFSDVDKAIECHTQAVQLTPDGHTDKPNWFNNLGRSYHCRFERHGKVADADEAIKCQTQAVELTPDGHVDKPSRLGNLGNSYHSRFVLLGGVDDIEKAIEWKTQAVQLTPQGHAHKPGALNNLGVSYRARFEHLGEHTDLEHARSSFQHAAELNITLPETQIICAREWATASLSLGLSPKLAFERCMELIPHLIWLGTTINQRYRLLSKISDFAAEAAAWAISVHAYDLSIEWLEEGRSIVWNQILQLRTPFDDLSSVDSALAQQLKDTATKLEGAGSRQTARSLSIDDSLNLEQEAQYHRRLADDWARLLEKARCIPGFDNFLRPRKAAELKLAATDGPVIVINTHSTRCDALIVFPQCDDVVHVPLEGYSSTKLEKARELSDSLVRYRGDRERGLKLLQSLRKSEDRFRTLLSTLWTDVVKPILDSCNCMPTSAVNELLHVTWCTTGALSFLPLHAAGCHDGSQPNAYDLVVSSYTPTLNALLTSNPLVSHSDPGLLAVGQQHTPGFHSLPSTVQELAVIKELTKATRFQQLEGQYATVDAVLHAMDKYNWVHLACHAGQNSENPACSAFYLHDGLLTLETITKRSFKHKGLAFLSACQTATGDKKLTDEAVHLAAGMLMAGYPSVIATMWGIRDEDGPEVAQGVYEELLRDRKCDHRGAARALHKAVAELRQKVGDSAFMRWVPFIHIGV